MRTKKSTPRHVIIKLWRDNKKKTKKRPGASGAKTTGPAADSPSGPARARSRGAAGPRCARKIVHPQVHIPHGFESEDKPKTRADRRTETSRSEQTRFGRDSRGRRHREATGGMTSTGAGGRKSHVGGSRDTLVSRPCSSLLSKTRDHTTR